LRLIVREAGLWTAARSDPTAAGRARDLKAISAFEEVLDYVALLGEADGGEIPCEAFVEEVTQGLHLASVSAEESADAPVVVMDVRQARALEFDHVYLLGLAEKEFPQRGRRHPFFDDAEREDLRSRRVDLADTGHDAQQEMLLYYTAVTRARQTLTLSYPSLDAEGRPALRSHYLEELEDLFAAGKNRPLPVTEVGTRDLDLPAERTRAEGELLAATLYDLWGPGETRRPDERLGIIHALLKQCGAAETAVAGLAVEWEREHGEAFGPFDHDCRGTLQAVPRRINDERGAAGGVRGVPVHVLRARDSFAGAA
jgi:hypothetical protein